MLSIRTVVFAKMGVVVTLKAIARTDLNGLAYVELWIRDRDGTDYARAYSAPIRSEVCEIITNCIQRVIWVESEVYPTFLKGAFSPDERTHLHGLIMQLAGVAAELDAEASTRKGPSDE